MCLWRSSAYAARTSGKALGGIEAGDLNNVGPGGGRRRFGHALFVAFRVEFVDVVLGIEGAELLVQAVEPVGRGRHIPDFLEVDGRGHELAHWMANEDIGALDSVPKPLPDF